MMELQELATAARAGFPLLVLVVHNSAYGNMKRDQIRHYDGRVTGTNLLIPDLPQVAAAFGVYGAKVERPADLEPAMRQALAVKGPALLDVVCPVEGI
jgi:acetolactate synthase-1/2/3 large subunit